MIDQNILYLFQTVKTLEDPICVVNELMIYLEPNTNMKEFGAIQWDSGKMFVGKATDFMLPVRIT